MVEAASTAKPSRSFAQWQQQHQNRQGIGNLFATHDRPDLPGHGRIYRPSLPESSQCNLSSGSASLHALAETSSCLLDKKSEDDPTALTLSIGHYTSGLRGSHPSSSSLFSPKSHGQSNLLSHDDDVDNQDQEWRYFAREWDYRRNQQKSKEGGSSSSVTKQASDHTDANLMQICDEEEGLAASAAAAAAASARDDAEQSREAASKSKDPSMKPFYVKNVPPTKVGIMFEAFQKQYWEAKRRGLEDLGNGRKFFTSRGLNLNREERAEFRRYAKRFTDMLADRRPKRLKDSQYYRLRRYGYGHEKTEAQCQQTKDKSQRHYLIRVLRKNLANMAIPGGKIKWTPKHINTLQQLYSRMSLKAGNPLIELYKQFLAANEGMQSCIPVPEE